MNVVFPPLNVGLREISRSRFKESRNSMLITQFYVCVLYLRGDSFSQRIGKIRRNKKFWRFNVAQKSNATSGFRCHELRKSLKKKPARLL